MNTELFKMSREECLNKIKEMETSLLFAELDDTIQFDILKISNEKWLTLKEKKVYQMIVNELRSRIN